MVLNRICSARKQDGDRCSSSPMRDAEFCFWHSPDHAEEATQARKLGGQRRRRESTLAGAYDVGALDTTEGIRRLLEVVVYDGLGMENSIARGRLLIAAAQTLSALLKTGELEDRLSEMIAILKPRIEAQKRRR